MAQLGELGFESFMETNSGVLAYISEKTLINPLNIADLQVFSSPEFVITFQQKKVEIENWNHTWETNFKPIAVGDECLVRASFHKAEGREFEIIITPKMSFGTGHHETTYMMLKFILEHDFLGKTILDMGSGTGVLAILLALKKAAHVDAVDIDPWCYENALENVELNQCNTIDVLQGNADLLKGKKYDAIFANINRNILLQDMEAYVNCLDKKGELYLSGFYSEDIPVVEAKCNNLGLVQEKKLEKNNWVALKYVH